MDKPAVNLLSVFIAVYEHRSITLAAEALEMTQPGVSNSLKRLKAQLGGIELFVRDGRGITPTHSAIQLANDISPALIQINNALSNLNQFSPDTSRQFKVLTTETTLQLLQPLVEASKSMGRCSIQFVLSPNTETEVLDQLRLQQADLAIDVAMFGNPSYSAELLLEEDAVLICSKNHPRIKDAVTQAEFYLEKHITIRARRSDITLADFLTHDLLGPRKISAECDSLLSMMALISRSDCIGFTSSIIAKQYAEMFNLRTLTPPFSVRKIQHKMIWHNRNQNSPANQWLRSKLSQLVDTYTRTT